MDHFVCDSLRFWPILVDPIRPMFSQKKLQHLFLAGYPPVHLENPAFPIENDP